MAKTVEYEGYTIHSTPQYQTDSAQWRLRIVISFMDHQGVRTREFSSEVLYATEQEADIHGATFGQRLIEGKVEGQSVLEMRTEERRAMPRRGYLRAARREIRAGRHVSVLCVRDRWWRAG
jgi:hypothetical protein